MSRLTHPHTTSKPTLDIRYTSGGAFAANIIRTAKYKRGALYETKEFFASIRPAGDVADMTHADGKFMVLRTTFDDVRYFDSFRDAELYVRGIFALEYS